MNRNRFLFLAALFCSLKLFSLSFSEAEKAYEQAEKAVTYEEREKGFNQALSFYNQSPIDHPAFHYNLANCYYQLSKPGYAIWYYEKALKQAPRHEKIRQNLLKAKNMAGLDPKQDPCFISATVFPTHFLALHEKNKISWFLACLVSLSLSAWIWFSKKVFKALSISVLGITSCFFLSWGCERAVQANEGILIEPSFLRCDAAEHYERVDPNALASGSKVILLKLSEDKKWVKVKVSSKKRGFVPLEIVRAL